MRAGRMRHRVKIQAPSNAAGAFGGSSRPVTYADVQTVWADVRPMTAKEVERAAALEVRASVIVSMRYFAGLTEAHRLELADGRILSIVGLRKFREIEWEHEATCLEVRNG